MLVGISTRGDSSRIQTFHSRVLLAVPRASQVFPFEELARLRDLPEDYEPPEPKPFKPRVDPSSWLADEQHRDQFVLRYSEPHASGKLVSTHTYE